MFDGRDTLPHSADRLAKMRVIARDIESSFLRALRSPPDSAAG
jgi:hypothetical protein